MLKGKTAIVTGASRGIGRAIAVRLGLEGANLVLWARDGAALTAVAAEAGDNACILAVDLRETGAAQQVVALAMAEFGGVDILVNNAGATKRGEFLALTDEDWMDGYALKLHGAVRMARSAWPELAKRGGSVVNIAGVGGKTPGAEFTIGGSVNAAVLSFTKALADVGVRDGVQVNAINPGTVRTDRFEKRLDALAAERALTRDAAEAWFVASQRVTRVGEPADIAGLVSFLVGPEGRFLHGALIDMDGGATKSL